MLEKELLRLAGFEDDISDDKETAHSGSSSLDDDDVSSSDSGESEDSGDNDSDELSDEDATRSESGSCQCSECLKMMKKERFCSCNLASKDALRQYDYYIGLLQNLTNFSQDWFHGISRRLFGQHPWRQSWW